MMKTALVTASLSTAYALDLLVVGDWGGVPFPPYSTPSQRAVADGMGKIGDELKVSAVLGLGDNFYFDGIATDSSSHRFEDTWNQVYPAESLQVPWYLLAGNHDHYGNVTAQLEYSQQSDRWNFPSMYYSKSFIDEKDGTTLDILFIDTVDLSGNTVGQETDPGYYDKLPYRAVEDAAEQWAWIAEQMAASTADHLLIAGHFPVYSICEHGNTGNLYDNLRPLLIEHSAHYIAGHDHCLESIQDDNGLLYIVTGAGNTCCTSNRENIGDVPEEFLQWYVSRENRGMGDDRIQGGFNSITVTEKGMSTSFYDQDGTTLFTTPTVPPRTTKQKK